LQNNFHRLWGVNMDTLTSHTAWTPR
jgi:hypothetical protein